MAQLGSLHNILMTNTSNVVPTVGMGATRLSWTDRHAYTVVRVDPKGKKLWATPDIATRVDKNGMSESQDYEYKTDPDAEPELFKKMKNGVWRRENAKGAVLSLGHRSTYHDFSF